MSLPHAASIKSDLERLIAQALPAKLIFDQACMRQGQFGETYIHNVIHESRPQTSILPTIGYGRNSRRRGRSQRIWPTPGACSPFERNSQTKRVPS